MNDEARSSEPPVWTEPLKFCSYDIDPTGCATAASLCRYFFEAAWNHAEALGFGFEYLGSQGKFWVLSRLFLEVQHYPAWRSTATLRTWPRGTSSAFAMRDFEIVNADGKRLAAGSSAWLILDTKSKRPQRPNKVLPDLEHLEGRSALGRDPQKLPDNDCWDKVYSVTVRHGDIDVHRHVNSASYIGWILDAYPVEFHVQNRIRALEVNYLGETLEGESLDVRTRRLESMASIYSHSVRKTDSTEVCRARVEWENAT